MRIFRLLFTIAHFVVILLLLGTMLNKYVPPTLFSWLNLLSLGFPLLMIVHIVFIITWLILRKKRALLFVALTLLLFNPIRRWVNFSITDRTHAELKIISMNVHGGKSGYENLSEYFQKHNADIVLLQEYDEDYKIPNYQYIVNDYPVVAINSKFKILKHEKLIKSGNGNAFYADVEINGKTIRIVNLYLNPFSFDKKEVKPVTNLEGNKLKLRYVIKTLLPIFKIHEKEVSEIRTAISNSPYPVILAGDFNAVPNSYEYYYLSKGLKDSFLEAGNGNGTTFHDYKFPIRIDYFFTSPSVQCIDYKVDRTVNLSDHYPVIAEFKLN